MSRKFNSVEEVLKDLREGKPVIVVDDPERENEGDFVVASEKVTPEIVNLMAKRGGGLICVTMKEERFRQLQLELPITNTSHYGTPFGVPIDAKDTSTGASAYDRALTARWVADPKRGASDFVRPGHLYTLKAVDGGVLKRAGHTEASVDLAEMAGLYPSAVICEILDEDGSMARLPKLFALADELGLKIISIAQIIEYRLRKEMLVKRVWEGSIRTLYGEFKAIVYKEVLSNNTHLALLKEPINSKTVARIQSHCVAGNVFRATGCKCGEHLEKSLRIISEEGGVFVYIRRTDPPEYPFFHLMGVEEDGTLREYGIGLQILKDLGVKTAVVLAAREKQLPGYEGFGIEVEWRRL